MSKKLLYLVLAFLLPIAIFVFLKTFGKNEFTIPVYYEAGVTEAHPSCNYAYPAPYSIPDSVLQRAGLERSAVVLYVADTSALIKKNLNRLSEEFKKGNYQLIFPSGDNGSLDTLYACFFFLKKPWSAVLIDSERRIRGYYTPTTREEMDRLIVEMKILLKQY